MFAGDSINNDAHYDVYRQYTPAGIQVYVRFPCNVEPPYKCKPKCNKAKGKGKRRRKCH